MPTLSELANPWVAGLPVYEPGRPTEEVARELGTWAAEDLFKLASNENALGPSPAALQAMAGAMGGMHRYPDGSGYYLRRAIARRLDLADENVVLGNGSNEMIELLAHVFLHPGAEVVVADRAFVVYRLVATAFQSGVVAVPMTGFTHDVDAMAAAVGPDTRLLFVSNPNNPTGTMVDGGALDRLLDAVPDHVVVVLDEAYIELLPPDRQPDTLRYVREGRKVFILRTFSKAYGLAGLRMGYALGPAEGAQLLQRVRQPFNANAMAQAAACAALEDDEHLERTRELVARGLEFLTGACERMGLPYVPSVANFLLIETGEGRAVTGALLHRGVIVRPMEAYQLPDHIRVTVGTPEENERFVLALETCLGRE
jgi:histidinol-phosphate aminotransferase